jgi:hypothetical protein
MEQRTSILSFWDTCSFLVGTRRAGTDAGATNAGLYGT